MKTSRDCYACLRRLALQAAGFAAVNPGSIQKATAKGLGTLAANFSLDKVSIVIAAKIHEAIREITGNADPYRELKDEGIRVARELS